MPAQHQAPQQPVASTEASKPSAPLTPQQEIASKVAVDQPKAAEVAPAQQPEETEAQSRSLTSQQVQEALRATISSSVKPAEAVEVVQQKQDQVREVTKSEEVQAQDAKSETEQSSNSASVTQEAEKPASETSANQAAAIGDEE